jgi:hypothetical protein
MKLVWEYLLRKEKPYDYCDRSSYLVLMLLEFCCGLPKVSVPDGTTRAFSI